MIVTAKPTNPAHPPGSRGPRRAASAASAGNTFPKSVRLLKHASFQHVYEDGRKHFSTTMIFFFVLKPVGEVVSNHKDYAPPLSAHEFRSNAADTVGTTESGNVQVGITVGRALGGAVVRNRIKRRMRDVVRHNLGTLREALTARGVSAEVVINPKKSVLTADIAALRGEVTRGFAVIAAANVSSSVAKPSGESRSR
jgi:ribonuclease P protein component